MTWETVIGLETHVELATKTKIFCSCTTAFGGAPNTHCCPVCMGMPGTLPVVNKKVVEFACKAGLALNCEITRYNKFDRKNYFYPDLPKAYQISQLYLPIARNGRVTIQTGERERDIRIHELHMEEDAGKLVHDPWVDQTKADYNRCGVPLIEIVTEPDFRTAEQVIAYLEKLKSTLEYLGVSDCKMQEGSLRCDVNLSVRPAGSTEFGTRTEMKNLNSFKAISRAIAYEARRQIELLEEGKRVIQETRRWDDNKDATFSMRSKENAQDYRYFPEPDIPPLELSEEYLDGLRKEQPEMAEERKERYQKEYSLPEYDAGQITAQKALVDFFEATVALGAPAKEAANWMLGEMMRRLKEEELEPKDMKLTPENLAALISMVEQGTINRNTAAKVFRAIFPDNADAQAYVKEHGLEQVSDPVLVEHAVEEAFAENADAVADFKAGNEKVLGFLVGQVMRRLKGKADPKTVNEAVRDRLTH
ncbi:Asp-tRNA(Asn)/Glu-tRNA(Gln) amidotransferase subunit GatB [Pseudoflavonifractor sp. AF19-9AC]|uniref:Asp-tRNA(Asn)/Glu-tRNA(Gln) amidotransferase subunit GatB n=1 Tax=Pseudoflavonifractor sp. AF19-9AC TaxID=2292244 RepID=UPI000E484B39|nr:Asp-tRNA(Asn)/Glu-tRNA(Gln) amidotransferase subunit GatB [Pseudoflavonifractor sp. AF19-9AC]RHR06098.1 Asp-tRNA(Asn)/Glu-tRNA(Gln) amidotransferase subunit GatB [Pseudoflavonifractor sp. AF19-9AC]